MKKHIIDRRRENAIENFISDEYDLDEDKKELKIFTEKERLTDDEIFNIKEFVLGCCVLV